jgi:hypothetical protein
MDTVALPTTLQSVSPHILQNVFNCVHGGAEKINCSGDELRKYFGGYGAILMVCT